MTASPTHPAKKGGFSMSLRKIIQEVEERSGRKFSGPELFQKGAPEPPKPHHPRPTRQVRLELCEVSRLSRTDELREPGAGRVSDDRPAPTAWSKERASPRQEDHRSGPEGTSAPAGRTGRSVPAVLSLLPQLNQMQDDAFLLLYLDLSKEFGKRFGAEGWRERVLDIAARGR